MNWLVFHIISGHSFFTGILLIIAAVAASASAHPLGRRLMVVMLLIGIIAVAVSSTAIPYFVYVLCAAALVFWVVACRRKRRVRPTAVLLIAVWLLAAALELPYHVSPKLHPVSVRSMTIIGDSVTAGIGGDETSRTWPLLLAAAHELEVQDLSHVGETAGSALKRVRGASISGAIVFVEIGGNDILGSTTPGQFAADLDALLTRLQDGTRQIVMFELPLPPFFHEFGRAQRELAGKHHVALIPKRVFLSVIAATDATLDTIHLSQSGHEFMADQVWRIVKSAFQPPAGA